VRSRTSGARRVSQGRRKVIAAMLGAWFGRIEDTLATVLALAVVTLPLAEITTRILSGSGVPGAGPFTRNLTMWLAMLGAAIAARDGKLLALATGTFLPE